MQSNHFNGYQGRQSQPSIIAELDYRDTADFDESNIDTWLTEYCGIDSADLDDPDSTYGIGPGRQATFAISRALAFYGSILTYIGIPSRKPGKVLRSRPSKEQPGMHRVGVLLEVLDNMPQQVFADLLVASLRVVREKFSAAPDLERAEQVQQEVKDQIIEEIAARVPFVRGGDSVLHEVHRQGLPYRHLGMGVLRVGWGSRSILLRDSSTDADSQMAKEICGLKHRTAQFLRAAGLPGAQNMLVESEQEAIAAAQALGWPVVVKPPHRERSEGLTLNVGSEAELATAYCTAAEYGKLVVVERQVPGACHRIWVAGGKFIYAVQRLPKGVRGDGKSSVADLIRQRAEEERTFPIWRRQKPVPADDIATSTLTEQGLDYDSVPDEGEYVKLRPFESDVWGGQITNVTETIHPENIDLALQAAKAAGLSICGIDLMSTDITRPWYETGAVINELNFRPAYRTSQREEAAGRVVPAIIDGDGRIPVHLVTGKGDLLGAALALRDQLAREGTRYHLTAHDYTEHPDGRVVHLDGSSVFERSLALALRTDVDGIVMAGPWPTLFKGGFAVDQLASVCVAGCDERTAEDLFRAVQSQVRVMKQVRLDGQSESAALVH